MEEIWKPIKDFEGYEVSNLGRVRSYLLCAGNGRLRSVRKKYKILKPRKDTIYLSVALYSDKKHYLKIHRLVASAFIKNIDNKPEINHKDFNSKNNIFTNLEWVTRKENINHSRHRMTGIGGRKTKFSISDIKFIKNNSITDILNKIAVSKNHIYAVKRNERWKNA